MKSLASPRRAFSRRSPFGRTRQLGLLSVAALGLVLAVRTDGSGQQFREINPEQSSLHSTDPDGASGGRVNGLASVSGNNKIFYAASEWGGLFKSSDSGRTWERLDNHRPTATWDVEVSPANSNRVFATSFYDGQINSLAGINTSNDGGGNWVHPTTATPPANFCADPSRRDEPSAFGIGIDPANAQNVYVGTNCGLAVSQNGGTTWQFIDPTPGTPADDIWDVVVHHGGIIDLCGDDGHQRSTDGGAHWTTAAAAGTPLPSGRCSLAVSPDESYVLFAVSGTSIFESDDGGGDWSTQFVNPNPQGRIPFVATNQRSGAAFDLWFGDVSLYRAGCQTPSPAAAGGAARCPASNAWAGGFTRSAGGHDDTADLVFDTQAASDPCPVLMASDGGVYLNSNTTSPGCQTPGWQQPDTTPRGLWLFGMAGFNSAGSVDLYFGTQDNGTFASFDPHLNSPTWSNQDCCDGFDDRADESSVLYTVCCYQGRANRLFVRNAGMTGGAELNNYPAGSLPGFTFVDVLDNFDVNSYVLVTTLGVFITNNVTANPVQWTQLGAASTPANACGVWASRSGGERTFYVEAGSCSGQQADAIWRYTGTKATGAWQEVLPPGGVGGFGVFAVDPNNDQRLFASHLNNNAVAMIRSNDGGATWTTDAALDKLMTGNGLYKYQTLRGPISFGGFSGYPQPTLVAFDPADDKTLLAGGSDSGIFLSLDDGANWLTLTDNSGDGTNPQIPRPRFAFFSRQALHTAIYVGTQGRGVWRRGLPPLKIPEFHLDEVVCPVVGCQFYLFDPRIYEFIGFDRITDTGACPGCTVELVFDGFIKDIVLTRDQRVRTVFIDRGEVRSYDLRGGRLPQTTSLSVQALGASGTRCARLTKGGKASASQPAAFAEGSAFNTCRGCRRAQSRGGVIRGIVLDKGKLRGLIVTANAKPEERTRERTRE